MIEIGIKFSKPGYDATEELKRLSFDSNTISHSVYRQEATELSTGANTFKHGLTYPPKVWVNAINSYNTNNDARVPIEITPLLSEENIDYKVNKENIIINDDINNRDVQIIIFTKNIRNI